MTSRRDQILATAAELFAARGFHGVSVVDIGAACGISGPALYKHFASKDAVLAEMLVSISEELLASAASGPAGGTRRDALRRAGRVARRLRAAAPAADRRPGPRLGVAARRRARAGPRPPARVRRPVGRPAPRGAPGLAPTAPRAMAHAAFGLLNSTPHSACSPSRRWPRCSSGWLSVPSV